MEKFKYSFILIFGFLSNSQSQSNSHVEFANERLHEFDNVRDFAISNDQDEVFFTIQSPMQEISQIAFMKLSAGKWTPPQLMEFSDVYADMEAFLSPDQTRLYFASNRPVSDTARNVKDYDIWYVERAHKQSPWSKPINLGRDVNTEFDEFYPTLASNNNLYFTSERKQGMGKDDIYFSKWNGFSYTTPQLMDSSINSSGYEFNAFISRNEDFIIYTKYNAAGGMGSGDLYISFRNSEGQWGVATNLGSSVNTKSMEYCPYYDEKNGILYFTSRRSQLAPKKFRDLDDFQKTIQHSENGYSKIYKLKEASKFIFLKP
ncbi:MAG: PD40 domain-containing protein [Saprospiraceae bacterium]|nr:PD40 domain-containing protein [Saprospiraceae bacterium]